MAYRNPDPSAQTDGRLASSASWHRIRDEFLSHGRPAAVLVGLTQEIDAIAVEEYTDTIQRVASHSAAMLAVGAYGRSESLPYSPAEILILIDAGRDPESLRQPLDRFAQCLVDAGVSATYTVRTIAECLDPQNVDLLVQLLDRRCIAGDRALHARLDGKLPGALDRNAQKIRHHLAQAARARHARFQNTYRHLEPDVKDEPGGLRDLRYIDWLHKLDPHPEPLSERMLDAGVFFSACRCFLHYHHGRDRNVLDAESQESLGRQSFVHGGAAAWMLEYYRHARAVFHEARRGFEADETRSRGLLDNLREYRTRLSNAEFSVSHEHLLLQNPARIEKGPALVFRMLDFVSHHGVLLAPETERRVEAAAHQFQESVVPWPTLRDILGGPHAPAALRAFENTSMLQAVFPEWAITQDTPAAATAFTAGEHALASIERLAALRSETEFPHRPFAGLLAEIDHPALLYFAALFQHTAARSLQDALQRIEMCPEDAGTVEFLLSNRREFATTVTATLDDPASVHALAENVGTIEHLRLLTLLTYAGIAASSPQAMTPQVLDQLWNAYSVTRHELTRELETGKIREAPPNFAGPSEFLQGFPVRYLRAHLPAEIEAHVRLYEQSRPTGVAIQIEPVDAAYRLTIVARDRRSMFAAFAGALSSLGFDIQKAEAFSNARNVVLDTFVFVDPKHSLQSNPAEHERLRDLIIRVALGKADVQRLIHNRPADSRKNARSAEVRFDSNACDTATLVEISAEDRLGLLYSLATVFANSNCNIDVVLIDFKGHRAIGVFYVTHEGHKLPPDMQDRLREKLLAAC